MKLSNILGNTFYILGGTNTGIYVFKDNTALMIDPGISGLRTNKIVELLNKNNIDLKFIIITHEHDDHYSASYELKQHYDDLQIISSKYAKIYIENQELFCKYIMGGKSNVIMDSKFKNRHKGNIKIDKCVKEGELSIKEVNFEIINFEGHTPGSIGILTDDKVLFVGDLLVGEEMLSKYDFLFLFDVEKQIKSLNKLKEIDFEYIVVAHSRQIISKEESMQLIKLHEEAIQKYKNQVLDNLKQQIGIETLLQKIIKQNKLSHNYKEYHFLKSSLISLMSYLIDLNEVTYLLNEGELLYYIQKI